MFAQKPPLIKVYAYSQAVMQGTKPTTTVDETGKEIKVLPKNKMSYFFYAEQKRSTVINIISVWIKDKNYGVKTSVVLQTPVEMKNEDPAYANKTITLVPKSSNKILLITPGSEKLPSKKPPLYLRKAVTSSELVIVYEWKGRFWYSEVKKIKELKPLAAV